MKRFNKFLALFLAVVMTVGLLPAAVSAATDPNVIWKNDFESITTELGNFWSPQGWEVPYFHLNNQNQGDDTSDIYTDTDGNKCIKLKATPETATWQTEYAYAIGLVAVGIRPAYFTANTEYKVSARVKADAANRNTVIDVYDTAASHILNYTTTVQTVGTEWTVVEYTFTTPADISSLGTVRFRIGYTGFYTNDANAYLMVDDFCVSKVPAYNYETMETELAAGEAKLLANVDGAGKDLILKSGKTLDLNGKTLTVDSLSALGGAKVKDTVGGGKVVVADGNLALQADNGYLPIKIDGGYAFSNVEKFNHEFRDAATGTLMYAARPSLGAADNTAYLSDGAANNGLSIMIRLTWTNSSGTTTTMDVPCSEDDIKTVYAADSTDAFVLTVTGVDGVNNLEVATVVCSDTGVVVVGDALSYSAQ